MASKILFASVEYDRYDASVTLPAKFKRMLGQMGLQERVKGKRVAIKMHLGRRIGYTTVHPLFIRELVQTLASYGAKPFITDQETDGAGARGYTEEFLGCPIVAAAGIMGKYFYPKEVDFRTLRNIDIAGHIHDADFMIDLSHVKGHGACGYGGACKNIAMGCVTDRTRRQIHGLEGGLVWNKDTCLHCDRCIDSCNHNANGFDKDGRYAIMYHNCTNCQHCVKVCPTNAISMDANRFGDFQAGMAICTKTVLDTLGEGNVYYINFLTNITAICDCWGMSTPNVVPDIGIMSGWDIVATERACLDAIKLENLLPNSLPRGQELGTEGHLFERMHGRNPFIQLDKLEEAGLGTQAYEFVMVD